MVIYLKYSRRKKLGTVKDETKEETIFHKMGAQFAIHYSFYVFEN